MIESITDIIMLVIFSLLFSLATRKSMVEVLPLAMILTTVLEILRRLTDLTELMQK